MNREKTILAIGLVALAFIISVGIFVIQENENQWKVENFSITPKEGGINSPIRIVGTVKNLGEEPREYTAILDIEGVEVARKKVEIENVTDIVFSLKMNSEGVYTASIGPKSDEFRIKAGVSPTLMRGYTWRYERKEENNEYRVIENVLYQGSSEKNDYYVAERNFQPPYNEIKKLKVFKSKKDLLPLREQWAVLHGGSFLYYVRDYSYAWEENLYPLEVGKEVSGLREENTYFYTMKENFRLENREEHLIRSRERELTITVLKKENISVSAGRFETYKIRSVLGKENKVAREIESWYSDEVLNFVKRETSDYSVLLENYQLGQFSN